MGHFAAATDLDGITAFDARASRTTWAPCAGSTAAAGGLLVASGPAYQFLFAQQDRITPATAATAGPG
jgi:hypothetical protein